MGRGEKRRHLGIIGGKSLKIVLLAPLIMAWVGSPLMAETLFFSGNLRTDATVTACGAGCTLGPSNTDYDYANYAAVAIDFTVFTPTTVEALTYSYGGGTSETGAVVPAGGLEPYLSLFDSAGDFLQSTYFGTTCPTGAHSVGPNCYDVELNDGTLQPGDYEIALTAYGNMSFAENNGPPATLADGFTGLGNLATTENLDYAFDLILPTNEVPVGAPEPGTLGSAMAAAMAGIAISAIKKRRQKR